MTPKSGLGENIRGTALGAVDTVGNKGYTENDEIARRGRVELEQGKANMQMPVDRAAPGAPGYGAGVTNTHAGAGTGTHTGITGAAHHPGSGLTGNQVHNVPPLPPRDAAQGGHGYADDVAPHNVGGGAGTTTNYNRS